MNLPSRQKVERRIADVQNQIAKLKRSGNQLTAQLEHAKRARTSAALVDGVSNAKARKMLARANLDCIQIEEKLGQFKIDMSRARGQLDKAQAELERIARQEKTEDFKDLSARRLAQTGVAERAIVDLVQALDQMANLTDRMRPAFRELCPPDPLNRQRSEFEGQLAGYEIQNRLEWYASGLGIQRYFGAQSSIVALPHASFTDAERAAQAYLVDLIDPPPAVAAAGMAAGDDAPAESAKPGVLQTLAAGIRGGASLLTGGVAQGSGD